MVDNHGHAGYKGIRTYLTRDGKAGFAIEKDGNVVSVFSTVKGSNALGKLIPFAVEHGGRKLDCFGMGLQNMYARYGAKAVARTAFNDEFAPDGWDGQSRPDIVAMTLPRSINTISRVYDKDRRVDISKVPMYPDYDSMQRARDRSMTRGGNALGLASQ